MPPIEEVLPMARPVHVESLSALRQDVWVGPHRLVADEPADVGGEDAGPTPIELLLAALGS